jgi:ubiquitin C-terminal hydrolase
MNNNNMNIMNNNNMNIMNNNMNPMNNNNMNPMNNNIMNPMNNNMNNQTDPNSFARFTKATDTGLKNQGNTSYLNAVLQFIGSIPNFANYFTKEKNKQYFLDNVPKCPLAFVTHRLFLHLYKYPENQERETYTPDSYLKVLQMKNLTYKTDKNRNPNDLLIFILDTLHNELNFPRNNNIIPPKNPSDKDNVCQCGFITYQNRYNSIVSNLLNWFQLKEISCQGCNNTTFSFHTYNTFDLDILGCSKMTNNNPINIYNCLIYNSMAKPKKAYCNNCRKFTPMLFSSKIYCSSNTFIFLLNRGNMDQNLINIRFQIEEKINIKKLIDNQNAPSLYQLNGIVSIELNNSKYVSFCMSPVDHNWYYYNDENIQPTNINNVLQLHNNGGYIPCILIYQSIQ